MPFEHARRAARPRSCRNLHAPGGPILKFPVLEKSAGSDNAPAPNVSDGDFLAAVREFAAEKGLARNPGAPRYSGREANARARQGGATVRHAIRKNLADFLAIMGVVVLGLGIGAYILSNQRLRFR